MHSSASEGLLLRKIEMFEGFANAFKITERHLTRNYIRRISVLSWIVFLSLLLEMIDVDWAFDQAPVFVPIALVIALLVVIAALIMLLCSPLVMRFWARDKFLDEWELDVKRRGMKSGYTVLLFTMLAVTIYFGFQADYSVDVEPDTISTLEVAEWSFTILVIAAFFQIQTQLRRIRPIDADDWDEENVEKNTIKGKVFVALSVLFILFGPAFCQGVTDGFNDAHRDAQVEQSQN